jgi:t-SNARE complex subunit (syntaxin)
MIDDIGDHIGRTADRTAEAHGELLRAERHQRSARSKKCFLLLMAALALAVLLIVLLS